MNAEIEKLHRVYLVHVAFGRRATPRRLIVTLILQAPELSNILPFHLEGNASKSVELPERILNFSNFAKTSDLKIGQSFPLARGHKQVGHAQRKIVLGISPVSQTIFAYCLTTRSSYGIDLYAKGQEPGAIPGRKGGSRDTLCHCSTVGQLPL